MIRAPTSFRISIAAQFGRFFRFRLDALAIRSPFFQTEAYSTPFSSSMRASYLASPSEITYRFSVSSAFSSSAISFV